MANVYLVKDGTMHCHTTIKDLTLQIVNQHIFENGQIEKLVNSLDELCRCINGFGVFDCDEIHYVSEKERYVGFISRDGLADWKWYTE